LEHHPRTAADFANQQFSNIPVHIEQRRTFADGGGIWPKAVRNQQVRGSNPRASFFFPITERVPTLLYFTGVVGMISCAANERWSRCDPTLP
jgi:hypothetical protein